MESRKKVEELKENWKKDPCWNIYDTEGFEEFRDELIDFQKQHELEEERIYQKKLSDKADSLGISGNVQLAKYILGLEIQIAGLRNQINSIQGQLYGGR
jgi:hypothetical protein